MKASVREFKARLSLYLRRAGNGEDVIITSRGRPIARLLPLAPEANTKPDASELARRLRRIPGMLPARGGKIRGAARPIVIGPGEKTLSEMVLENRR
ncbi:type II toxin-antitoxin system Phd/YefM family antitoxin [Candidatus Binatus sp.]|jgi:prevent-host-death family protein|uniref:type II toxin-antitoxin system Phd/YefM family antitoxin n=1 Tax=Candidatus Binatus sp. TaxID=2811406 RepID=UPI003C78FD03